MSQYRISEVAAHTGFPPATLRYYEQVGLLPEVARTPAGYRIYDEHAVQRLRVIARGKTLGLSLDEITELTAVWDEDRCGPVQDRLRDLIDGKITEATTRIGQLRAFVADLEAARDGLTERTPAGPCDAACGCTSETVDPAAAVSVVLAPRVEGGGQAPIACTLDPGAVEDRLGEWRELLGRATRVEVTPRGARILFDADVDVAAIARLAAAEQDCCAFLRLALTIAGDGTTLEVEGPPDALPVVDALVGVAR